MAEIDLAGDSAGGADSTEVRQGVPLEEVQMFEARTFRGTSGRTVRVCGIATLALLTVAAAPGQSYRTALLEGRTLTPEAVPQLESVLKANPQDSNARARLLGYYSARAAQDPAARLARLQQVEWLVENEPDSFLLRDPAVRLQRTDFAPPYASHHDRLRNEWKKQVELHPGDAILIENAWASLAGPEFSALGGAAVTAADYTGGKTSVEYLKRLRVLEPGDPEWALDLAGVYAASIPYGDSEAANERTRVANAMKAELEKSQDAAVIGLAGALLYWGTHNQQAVARTAAWSESLLRRASQLNPKNQSWAEALRSPVPSSAEMGIRLTGLLKPTDMWPGASVPETPIPAGAVRTAFVDLMAKQRSAQGSPTPAILEINTIPPGAIGAGCTVRFDALIGRDGRVADLRIVAFDRVNIPFFAAERDAIRQLQLAPTLVNGRAVEVAASIDRSCPPAPQVKGGIAGGVVGGVPGGIPGGLAPIPAGGIAAPPPPPPPPPPPSAGGAKMQRVGGTVQAAKLIKRVTPVYPSAAKSARVRGTVVLDATIAKDGTVGSLKVVSGPALLVQSALDAVKQWVYAPTEIDGAPVEVQTQITVSFTLE
jgi:TonB family protein